MDREQVRKAILKKIVDQVFSIIQLSNGDFRMALNVLPLTGINYNLTKRQFNLSFDLLSKRGRSRYRSNMKVFSASKMLSFLRCVPA